MDKWAWKMDYCKKKGIPPAQKWAWDQAEEVYNKSLEQEKKNEG